MQVGQLVPGTRRLHRSQVLQLALLLVEHPEVVEDDRAEVVLLLLASAHVDLVEHLDGRELTGQLLHIGQAYLAGLLAGQLMDVDMAVLLVPVVESGLLRLQNIVRLEADDVLEEAAELVGLR